MFDFFDFFKEKQIGFSEKIRFSEKNQIVFKKKSEINIFFRDEKIFCVEIFFKKPDFLVH